MTSHPKTCAEEPTFISEYFGILRNTSDPKTCLGEPTFILFFSYFGELAFSLTQLRNGQVTFDPEKCNGAWTPHLFLILSVLVY